VKRKKEEEYQPPRHTHDEQPGMRCQACELEFGLKAMGVWLNRLLEARGCRRGFEEITEDDVTKIAAYNAKFTK
jgi:hypothetical protein